MDINNSKKNLPKLIKIVFPHNYSSIALIEIIHSSFGTKKLSFVVHFQKMVSLLQDFNHSKYSFREKNWQITRKNLPKAEKKSALKKTKKQNLNYIEKLKL